MIGGKCKQDQRSGCVYT